MFKKDFLETNTPSEETHDIAHFYNRTSSGFDSQQDVYEYVKEYERFIRLCVIHCNGMSMADWPTELPVYTGAVYCPQFIGEVKKVHILNVVHFLRYMRSRFPGVKVVKDLSGLGIHVLEPKETRKLYLDAFGEKPPAWIWGEDAIIYKIAFVVDPYLWTGLPEKTIFGFSGACIRWIQLPAKCTGREGEKRIASVIGVPESSLRIRTTVEPDDPISSAVGPNGMIMVGCKGGKDAHVNYIDKIREYVKETGGTPYSIVFDVEGTYFVRTFVSKDTTILLKVALLTVFGEIGYKREPYTWRRYGMLDAPIRDALDSNGNFIVKCTDKEMSECLSRTFNVSSVPKPLSSTLITKRPDSHYCKRELITVAFDVEDRLTLRYSAHFTLPINMTLENVVDYVAINLGVPTESLFACTTTNTNGKFGVITKTEMTSSFSPAFSCGRRILWIRPAHKLPSHWKLGEIKQRMKDCVARMRTDQKLDHGPAPPRTPITDYSRDEPVPEHVQMVGGGDTPTLAILWPETRGEWNPPEPSEPFDLPIILVPHTSYLHGHDHRWERRGALACHPSDTISAVLEKLARELGLPADVLDCSARRPRTVPRSKLDEMLVSDKRSLDEYGRLWITSYSMHAAEFEQAAKKRYLDSDFRPIRVDVLFSGSSAARFTVDARMSGKDFLETIGKKVGTWGGVKFIRSSENFPYDLPISKLVEEEGRVEVTPCDPSENKWKSYFDCKEEMFVSYVIDGVPSKPVSLSVWIGLSLHELLVYVCDTSDVPQSLVDIDPVCLKNGCLEPDDWIEPFRSVLRSTGKCGECSMVLRCKSPSAKLFYDDTVKCFLSSRVVVSVKTREYTRQAFAFNYPTSCTLKQLTENACKKLNILPHLVALDTCGFTKLKMEDGDWDRKYPEVLEKSNVTGEYNLVIKKCADYNPSWMQDEFERNANAYFSKNAK